MMENGGVAGRRENPHKYDDDDVEDDGNNDDAAGEGKIHALLSNKI